MENLSNQKVVIDADFFRHTTEHEIGTALFEKLMSENGYIPVMHKYVSAVELKDNDKLASLIRNKKIIIISEKDYLKSNDVDYREFFLVMYQKLNGVELGEEDIATYGYDGQCWGESLGEIRSVYLAYSKGYSLLLSDDHGAREAVEYISSSKHTVEVRSFYDLLKSNIAEEGSLRWKDIKYSAERVFKRNLNKYNELEKLYKDK